MVDFGYHIIQSFNGKEASPEKCNQIGLELAQNLWGDKYQVLVCTHINKDNIHNHIVLNSVSFIDGSKYHNSNTDIAYFEKQMTIYVKNMVYLLLKVVNLIKNEILQEVE